MKRTTLFFLIGALIAAVGCGGEASTPVFTETWADGAGAWRAVDGNPITVSSEADCPAFQHETIEYSGGRVVTRAATAVDAGQPYCMTAWARATDGAIPFLGFQLSDAAGNPGGLEQWPLGFKGYTSGDPIAVTVGVRSDGSWGWYSAPITMDVGASYVVFKDENFSGGGAVDLAAIQLFAGACPEIPATTC